MTGVLEALVEASFHRSKDGRILYRLGGFWGNDTYVVDSARRADELRRTLYFWYWVGVFFCMAVPVIPHVPTGLGFWSALLLLLSFLPAFVLSFQVVPKDLPKSPDAVSFDQLKAKFLGSLSYGQLIARLLIATSVAVGSEYSVNSLALESPIQASLQWVHWVSAALALWLLACLFAKLR